MRSIRACVCVRARACVCVCDHALGCVSFGLLFPSSCFGFCLLLPPFGVVACLLPRKYMRVAFCHMVWCLRVCCHGQSQLLTRCRAFFFFCLFLFVWRVVGLMERVLVGARRSRALVDFIPPHLLDNDAIRYDGGVLSFAEMATLYQVRVALHSLHARTQATHHCALHARMHAWATTPCNIVWCDCPCVALRLWSGPGCRRSCFAVQGGGFQHARLGGHRMRLACHSHTRWLHGRLYAPRLHTVRQRHPTGS